LLGAAKKALGSKPDEAELQLYLEIDAEVLGEVVRIFNAGKWGAQNYEEVIDCYAAAGTFFVEELPDYSLREDKVRKFAADLLTNWKILYGLN